MVKPGLIEEFVAFWDMVNIQGRPLLVISPSKINMSPEKGPFQKENILPTRFFGVVN